MHCPVNRGRGHLASVGRISFLYPATEMTIENLRGVRNKLVFLCSSYYIWQQGTRKSQVLTKLILGVVGGRARKRERQLQTSKQGEQNRKRQNSTEARSLGANSLLVSTIYIIQVTVELLLEFLDNCIYFLFCWWQQQDFHPSLEKNRILQWRSWTKWGLLFLYFRSEIWLTGQKKKNSHQKKEQT